MEIMQKTNSWTEYGDYAKKGTHRQNMEIIPKNELIDRIWRLCQKTTHGQKWRLCQKTNS